MATKKERATLALVDITEILETTDTHVTVRFSTGRVVRLRRKRVEFLPGMVQLPQWYLDYLTKGGPCEARNH